MSLPDIEPDDLLRAIGTDLAIAAGQVAGYRAGLAGEPEPQGMGEAGIAAYIEASGMRELLADALMIDTTIVPASPRGCYCRACYETGATPGEIVHKDCLRMKIVRALGDKR